MDLYPYIFKRKSVRQYDMNPLAASELEKIHAFIKTMKPLYPEIQYDYRLDATVRNLFPVKAPHYFSISSDNSEGYLENIGFLFQQLDLFLSSIGLGGCWLGTARPSTKQETAKDFVIAYGFGRPKGDPYRSFDGFKRQPLQEISLGLDSRLEAARLAPSASNTQNWFFVCDAGHIHVYQKLLNPLKAMLYNKFNRIDTGIAICHLYLATIHEDKEFVFSPTATPPRKGYRPIGTVH